MKIKFDKQPYQLDAIQSITDIFAGQTLRVSNFTVSMGEMVGQEITELGIGNKLELSEAEVLENVQKIQIRNLLKKSTSIQDWNFTVEMETGTGKTYVYTRSIFELNKRYGFSKFIIVVPSVAIREGVFKSLQMTEEHFAHEYPGLHCHYFKYDSSKLEQVREFAISTNIEVMIINIDAFRKSFDDPEKESKANLIHRERDTMNGKKPIQFIQETNPVVIIDEPQSVDNTEKAKEAISSLNPLCKLRYSATHKETYNLMYKLDPVDAFEQKLVKKVEVLSVHSDDDFNDPYIKLLGVSNTNGFKATVEIDVKKKNGTVSRAKKEINTTTKKDLYVVSGERELYHGYVVEGIDCTPGNEKVEFENEKEVLLGQAMGGIDDDLLKRYQIREAIRTHLDKELRLVHKGIKVLTLFFIDLVENYRIYPKGEPSQKGKYAMMFEEEYEHLIKLPKYRTLFAEDKYISNQKAIDVHDGYFSRDKSGQYKNSKVTKEGTLRINKDDESAFELIMKEKEKLLSFSTPLRFIFSHSALKEGWDNPNVFQICTLVETKDPFTKRQKIGRGLRLPVNQDGQRQYDENVNILTVIANESYQQFSESLQREIEEETGVKFGYLEEQAFAAITRFDEHAGEAAEIGYESSAEIYSFFVKEKYLDKKGKVETKCKDAIASGTFLVPEEFADIQYEIEQIIKRAIKTLPVFNKKEEVEIKLNKEVLLSEEFHQLWEQIKYKTTYSVELDTDELKARCIEAIQKLAAFKARKIKRENAVLTIDRTGVTGEGNTPRAYEALEERRRLPDILRYLQEQTNLKRRTLVDILIGSNRLNDFEKNPQAFMEEVMKIINREKRKLIIDGIKYERIGDHAYYQQSLFDHQELVGYMKANAVEAPNKSIYNHIRYDSVGERAFAEKLNNDEDVKLFVKLPSAFVIDTPLGNYNPNWAVLIDKAGIETLYFVVETKGSLDQMDLRLRESGKIACGRNHFEALKTHAEYKMADSYEEFKMEV
ncbi:DEAD/DEAH box helicase family protein [Niallia oryzisoli]|uniref:DEAD/DEAH box helicase family protein n=1 Tax=Niallia oryzisoli TaxID=1737571 RepID=A0ABZ2CKQ1_9BACI